LSWRAFVASVFRCELQFCVCEPFSERWARLQPTLGDGVHDVRYFIAQFFGMGRTEDVGGNLVGEPLGARGAPGAEKAPVDFATQVARALCLENPRRTRKPIWAACLH